MPWILWSVIAWAVSAAAHTAVVKTRLRETTPGLLLPAIAVFPVVLLAARVDPFAAAAAAVWSVAGYWLRPGDTSDYRRGLLPLASSAFALMPVGATVAAMVAWLGRFRIAWLWIPCVAVCCAVGAFRGQPYTHIAGLMCASLIVISARVISRHA